MLHWGRDFTCIAPDTAGFGESDPLPMEHPEVEDYADATAAFIEAIGLDRVAAYGFHSGAIILVTAGKRHPRRFSAIAANGYAVWTEAEKSEFAGAYLPPFLPQAYGEHLAWLWRRIMEQSWVFPWYDMRPDARLGRPHADAEQINIIVMEMLAAGDNYRRGYGAVLRANRDIPSDDGTTVPTFITAPDGDPLQTHIGRLGTLPANWTARPLPTLEDTEAASREFLLGNPPPAAAALKGDADAMGFIKISAGGFRGDLHWQGPRDAARIRIAEAGLSARAEAVDDPAACIIALPGHGLSDDWQGASHDLGAWADIAAAALAALTGGRPVMLSAGSLSGPLASAVCLRRPEVTMNASTGHASFDHFAARAMVWPDLTPVVHGGHLHAAWHWARTRRLFSPWFDVRAATAIPFDPASLLPERIAIDHLAALQARQAPALLAALNATFSGGSGT